MSRSADLSGVRLKIDRARVHASELDCLVDEALDVHQKQLVATRLDEHRIEYRIKHIPQVPPEVSAVVGDALTNLRAALDHLAWQVVLADGKQPTRQTTFPVLAHRPSPASPVQLRPRIGRPDLLRALDEAQPYHVSDSDQAAPHHHVRLLKELVNVDKHRTLLLAISLIDDITWGLPPSVETPRLLTSPGPLRDGDSVVRFDFRSAAVPDSFAPEIRLRICLDDPGVPETMGYAARQPIGQLIAQMIHMVAFTVEHRFAPLLG